MVELIIVTHGDYGKAMFETSKLIMGEQENVSVFGLHLGDSVDTLRDSIVAAIDNAGEREVLVLTDMLSGSPFNTAVSLMQSHTFQHVTGINLPTLLEILGSRDCSTAVELCDMAMTIGKGTMMYVNRFLEEKGV